MSLRHGDSGKLYVEYTCIVSLTSIQGAPNNLISCIFTVQNDQFDWDGLYVETRNLYYRLDLKVYKDRFGWGTL